MEKKALEELLKIKTPEQIIYKHIFGEIYLNNFQLDKLLRLVNGDDNNERRNERNIKQLES